MATFLLVHGGWEGGWVWRGVERCLREAGHEVFRPTLTGLGERAHLSSPEVDLETHIADVLGVLRWERLEGVTLVGHSYGGMVVTGVADRAHGRIGALIYLDAFMPKDGEALVDLTSPERAAGMRKMAEEAGDGWLLPAKAMPTQHVTDPSEAALLEELCVPHPLATLTQELSVAGNHQRITKKAFVRASAYVPSPFARFAEEARGLGWPVEELPTHHFTMVSMPRETADALMRHAA